MTPRTAHTTRRDKAQIVLAFVMCLGAIAIAFARIAIELGVPQ